MIIFYDLDVFIRTETITVFIFLFIWNKIYGLILKEIKK